MDTPIFKRDRRGRFTTKPVAIKPTASTDDKFWLISSVVDEQQQLAAPAKGQDDGLPGLSTAQLEAFLSVHEAWKLWKSISHDPYHRDTSAAWVEMHSRTRDAMYRMDMSEADVTAVTENSVTMLVIEQESVQRHQRLRETNDENEHFMNPADLPTGHLLALTNINRDISGLNPIGRGKLHAIQNAAAVTGQSEAYVTAMSDDPVAMLLIERRAPMPRAVE